MMDPDQIEVTLKAEFPDAEFELVDLTGTKDHYELNIASSAFEGLTPIRQHKLVYQALGGAVGSAIHALALHTFSPAAWAARKAP